MRASTLAMCLAALAMSLSSSTEACRVKDAKARRMARARTPIERPTRQKAVEAPPPAAAPTEAQPEAKPAVAEPAETKPTPVEAKTPEETATAEQPAKKPGKLQHDEIRFSRGRSILDPMAKKNLDQVAAFLMASPDVKLSIEGHADASGSPDANMALSQKRAEAVKEYLEAKGVPSDRLSAEGVGDKRPKYAPTDKRNRRAALATQ